MGKPAGRKRIALWIALALVGALLTGCATVPPQPITGAVTTQSPTDPPAQTQPPEGGAEPSGEGDPSTQGGAQPTQGAAAGRNQEGVTPSRVELFYSGMPSLMGFADAPQTTIYENVMDALPACVSLIWPEAATTYYRYSADAAREAMAMTKAQLLPLVGEPYFYRDTPLLRQPDRLKVEGMPLVTDAANLNEPVRSFYEMTGQTPPTARSSQTGTQVALAASDTAADALTLIVTDLHELRMDDGALLTALNERCLALGRTVGLAAIASEFAGYIPDIGANNTTFLWGAPPTGTLDYLLDYNDYRVGVSIDPEQRGVASRPFYVLVIGDQAAVDAYLQALGDRLSREFAGNSTFRMETAVFGGGYVPQDYTLAGNMRYVAGQGVTAIPDTNAPAGISLIELKASPDARYLEWQVDYTLHPADPRGTNLHAEDFTFFVEAITADGVSTVLPHLTWSIVSTEGSRVTLSLRVDLPDGSLPQGSYTMEIISSLAAPSELPGAEWLSQFGYDADGTLLFDMEQNTAAFDGSRTLFLSRLIDTLGKANLGRQGVTSLGTVTIQLTVYA